VSGGEVSSWGSEKGTRGEVSELVEEEICFFFFDGTGKGDEAGVEEISGSDREDELSMGEFAFGMTVLCAGVLSVDEGVAGVEGEEEVAGVKGEEEVAGVKGEEEVAGVENEGFAHPSSWG
jgi:hypothetical protein